MAIAATPEKEEIKKRWDAFYNEVAAALGYLPLTIHWCVLLSFYVFMPLLVSTVHAILLHGNKVAR